MKTLGEKSVTQQKKESPKNYASIPVNEAVKRAGIKDIPVRESEMSTAWQDERALDAFKW